MMRSIDHFLCFYQIARAQSREYPAGTVALAVAVEEARVPASAVEVALEISAVSLKM
jgi:hypothetical protein